MKMIMNPIDPDGPLIPDTSGEIEAAPAIDPEQDRLAALEATMIQHHEYHSTDGDPEVAGRLRQQFAEYGLTDPTKETDQ